MAAEPQPASEGIQGAPRSHRAVRLAQLPPSTNRHREVRAPEMPRLLHLADVHLGARHHDLGEAAATQRERQFDAFRRAIDLALAEKVDVVLVAGDLFDSNQQPRRSVERAAAEFGRLAAAGIRTVDHPGHPRRLRPVVDLPHQRPGRHGRPQVGQRDDRGPHARAAGCRLLDPRSDRLQSRRSHQADGGQPAGRLRQRARTDAPAGASASSTARSAWPASSRPTTCSSRRTRSPRPGCTTSRSGTGTRSARASLARRPGPMRARRNRSRSTRTAPARS